MRTLTRTTGYYKTINSLRTSHIMRRSDDENTDVRCLGIILQSNLQGRGTLQGQEDKGCANNTYVGQLSIMQKSNGTTKHFTTTVQTGTIQHHAIIKRNNKALYNNQLVRSWDCTRSNMPRIGRWGFTQQSTWWGQGILWGGVTCEAEWHQGLTTPHYATIKCSIKFIFCTK